MLVRESYRGVFYWFQTRKRNAYGRRALSDRPKEERVAYVDERLRLIDDALWNRVQSRLKTFESHALCTESGRLCGRPPKHAVNNLLSGLAKCGVCGGGIVVHTHGKARRNAEYVCNRARTNGRCSNRLRLPLAELNETILQAVEAHVLTPEAIEHVVLHSERTTTEDECAKLDREEKDVEKRLARIVAAIEAGAGVLDTLVAKLRTLEDRKAAIGEERLRLRPVPRLPASVVTNHLEQSRAVLQRIIDGRITLTPTTDADGAPCYRFTARTRFDRLCVGLGEVRSKAPPGFIAPGDVEGTEQICPNDYSGEEEYHRLLERAYERGAERGGAPGGT
jgi:hypothetical protein